jgi:hypothetical protein
VLLDAAQRILYTSWENSATGALIVQLNRSRMNFRQHPLYRRWSDAAYDHRFAYLAETVPGHVAQLLPVALIFGPMLPFVVVVLFGTSAFKAFLVALAILLVTLALLIASADAMLAAGLTAGSLSLERESGRWQLLMLIPDDRMAVVMMRVASMLMPYRPLVGTMDLLQTVFAFIAALILSGRATEMDSNLLGLCMLFFLPSLLLLGWERQQDFALSVSLGVFAGLIRNERLALGLALSSGTGVIFVRLVVGMIAVGVAPTAHGFWVVLPVSIAGPAMLPMMGIPIPAFVPILLVYYGGREFVIRRLLREGLLRATGWD